MEFVKGTTYFDKCSKKIKQYPYLDKEKSCDILIVGGGIDGAILNFYLAQDYDVILVDKSILGKGSTCCATALLEFQLDDFAEDLEKVMTKNDVINVYKMGRQSIQDITNFIKANGNKCEYKTKSSFLYSNKLKDLTKIKNEYKFRKDNNFVCEYFDKTNNPFPFDIVAGIFDKYGGAEFNPYLFEKQMIESSKNQNNIFENTSIEKLVQKDNKIFCYTNFGEKIVANKVIFATGFNFEHLDDRTKNICMRSVTYSVVTNQLLNFEYYDKALIQDCLDNYHYLRLLPDNRIIFGGEDNDFNGKEIDENKAKEKYTKLLKQLKILFPSISDRLVAEFEFCGMFGSTTNNLGIVGKSINPNIMYFLSCGANGIINSFAGVKIIKDILNNKKNQLEDLFSPLRN